MTDTPATAPVLPAARCWTVHGPGGARDLEVVAAEDATLADVLPVLGRLLGAEVPELWAGSTRLAGHLPLSAPALAHGAALGLGRPGPRAGTSERSSALELHVTGGPGAGATFPLSVGSHALGRGSDVELRLADPDVSRRHAVVRVGPAGITVADAGSTNGTVLDGAAVGPDPLPWSAGGVLRLGATALTLRSPESRPVLKGPAPGGRLVLSPVPAAAVARPETEVVVPAPPVAPQRRGLPWGAVALPAVAGVAMALLLHAPSYLFVAGLSPVVAVSGWWSDRRSGRRTHRREVAAHAEALRAAEERLAAAVAADARAAEAAAPDLALLTSAARRRSAPLWSRRSSDPAALTVRLGTGPAPTRVTRREGATPAVAVEAPDLPVLLDLRVDGGLGIVGPRRVALEVLSAVVAQLAVLHAPGEVDLLLLTAAGRMAEWSWARWLPHLRVLADAAEAETVLAALTSTARIRGGAEGPRRWTVLVLDESAPPTLLARLHEARGCGVVVLTSAPTAEELPSTGGAVLRMTGEIGTTGVLTRRGGAATAPVLLDRLGEGPAALLARDLAPLSAPTAEGSLPTRVRLLGLPGPALRLGETGQLTGRWSADRGSLVATLGSTADGPVTVDLCAVGPHALVAGTTGAGKSELLQTLIGGLALQHPPDRCSFLLVDYKGGAAFAEAAGLPHTVGMLTDLDVASTTRALRSLTAELSRREALLAEHAATDIADLPSTVQLSRLVIVVDEFAGLAEELPAFVPGLVGIAQRGRSLGVHLVLATQRPSGVVSPEIRANCTLRICLRTTDEGDSRDVLGTPDAAHLPVGVPGRAYLRVGSGPPTLFQVARVSVAPEAAPPAAVVRPWSWPHPDTAAAGIPSTGRDTDLARVVAALRGWARRCDVPEPHRPWLPPLPDRLTLADLLSGAPDRSGRVVLGLLDRPATQSQQPLHLDLSEGGGWLVAGGPRSGRTTALRTVLAQAVTGTSPGQMHVHVVDHGGGGLAAEAAGLPHTGTVTTGDDVLRTVRLLDRLTEEITARRARGGPAPQPWLLLLVDGVESLMAQLDDADPARGAAAFLRLVRDGAAAGLTCVLTADRAVPGARLAGAVGRRLVLPFADRADYAVAGIPSAAVPEHRPPGRAVLADEGLELQVVLPPPLPDLPGPPPGFPVPLRIAELVPDPLLPGAPDGLRLRIGPGGDEGAPLTVDLSRSGGLLVVGPPGSGRTAALDAFAGDLSSAGVPVLRVQHRRSVDGLPSVAPGDVDAVHAWLDGLRGRTGVLLADDLGPAAEWPVLTALPGGARSAEVVLIAAGTAGNLTGHYQGAVAGLRRSRGGLLLCPGPGEAELLGIRLPRLPVPVRPGSGWLVTAGEATRVQVARRRLAQRRSSIGPISCVAYQASS